MTITTRLTCLLLLFSLLSSGQLLASDNDRTSLAGTIVRFCADDAQWPPYSYTSGSDYVEGFTAELVRIALARHDIQTEIVQIPWRRCLVEADRGEQYQVALDASWNPERSQKYLLTLPYYQLTPYYFYSRTAFPEGLSINSGSELASWGTICGLPGYNYSNFAIGDQQVYTGASDFYAVAEMTHRGRCGLFLGRFEIIAGLARIDRDLLADPKLAWAPIPDARPEPFYMLISRNFSAAKALKSLLDQTITEMSGSGELELLLNRFR